MSYQFELNRSNRSLRFPVILMAGLVVTVLAAYTFAACGDRNPDQARASERVSQPTGDVSSGTSNAGTTTEQPALVISGPPRQWRTEGNGFVRDRGFRLSRAAL